MKTITITDGPARYTVFLREDANLPELALPDKPGHQQFLSWWREYTEQMHIPYSRSTDPQSLHIIKHLLESHGLEELKKLAVHFCLDHGDKLREDARHFVLFASMLPVLKEEIAARDGKQKGS